jgi:hypothetical protein
MQDACIRSIIGLQRTWSGNNMTTTAWRGPHKALLIKKSGDHPFHYCDRLLWSLRNDIFVSKWAIRYMYYTFRHKCSLSDCICLYCSYSYDGHVCILASEALSVSVLCAELSTPIRGCGVSLAFWKRAHTPACFSIHICPKKTRLWISTRKNRKSTKWHISTISSHRWNL